MPLVGRCSSLASLQYNERAQRGFLRQAFPASLSGGTAMSGLVRERAGLGDREPILVKSFFIPRRPLAPRPAARAAKRRLVPPHRTERECGKVH